MPESSPFVTSVAFHVVQELDVSVDYQTVGDGVTYLEQNYDDSFGDWDQTDPSRRLSSCVVLELLSCLKSIGPNQKSESGRRDCWLSL